MANSPSRVNSVLLNMAEAEFNASDFSHAGRFESRTSRAQASVSRASRSR